MSLDSLREMISEPVIDEGHVKFDMGSIDLEEQDNNVDMRVTIEGIDGAIAAIRMGTPSPVNSPTLFKGGIRQICDYILFAYIDNTPYAIFVELKKTFNDRNAEKACEQLFRSRPMLDYILSAYGINFKSSCEPRVRYAFIYDRTSSHVAKEGTRPKRRRGEIRQHESILVKLLPTPRVTINELIDGFE